MRYRGRPGDVKLRPDWLKEYDAIIWGFGAHSPFKQTVNRPSEELKAIGKNNASAMISDEMLDTVTAECDAAVGAYGH